eukprot:13299907-Ditylum_brightwellii.AAC.1
MAPHRDTQQRNASEPEGENSDNNNLPSTTHEEDVTGSDNNTTVISDLPSPPQRYPMCSNRGRPSERWTYPLAGMEMATLACLPSYSEMPN